MRKTRKQIHYNPRTPSEDSDASTVRKRKRLESERTPSTTSSSSCESIPSDVVRVIGPESSSRIAWHIKNVVPYEQGPRFSPTDTHNEYSNSTYEQRRAEMASCAHVVKFDEIGRRRGEHAKLLGRIERDDELRGFWRCDISGNKEQRRQYRVLGQRTEQLIASNATKNQKKESDDDIMQFVDFFAESAQYTAPRLRILVTSNLSKNKENIVPVYSNIPGETVSSLEIPDSLLYTYLERNVVNEYSEKQLANVIEMSKKKENMIVCTCCSSEPIVPCFENSDCPCYQMNKKLKSLQPEHVNKETTDFSSFKKILFNVSNEQFFHYAGFGCSDECACKGKCTNNPMLLIEKRLFPLEIFRSDISLGFCIRSPVLIPGGTPIMEFVGEMVRFENMVPENQEYAYQISYPEDNLWIDFIANHTEFEPKYTAKLISLARRKLYIDPTWMGNIGRTAGHSCCANMELVRIYQKSLSPAHIRLIMVTLEDVYPGVPLTIDYGSNYVKQNLEKCLCGTFGCSHGRHFAKFAGKSFQELSDFHARIAIKQNQKWRAEIVEKVSKTTKSSVEHEVIVLD